MRNLPNHSSKQMENLYMTVVWVKILPSVS